MNNLITFLTSTLRMAVIAFALSAIFSLGQWLFSLMSICEPPTWGKFLWGGLFLFAILFIYAAYKAIKAMIDYRNEKKR